MGLDIKSVLVVDGVGANCAEILNSHGIKVVTKAKITKEELLKEIPNHEGLVVRSATTVTKEVLDAGKKLKVVGRAGAGVDNIDVAAAGSKGIGVINAPGANALSACELTCGLMLALSRHVVPAAAALRAGRWERTQHTGSELAGKTLGVLGLGRVGREVATRMHAFGMTIVGFDPFVSAEQCKEFHTTKMELDQIWPVVDYITLHTPLIDSTRNFINAKTLKQCKKGVKIINVGRGGLIQEKDLLDALQSGQVGGAALDVFEQEPPTDPLTLEVIQHPAVIATPHLGASTKEAQVRVGQEIAEQFVNLVKPGTYPTPLAEVTRVLNK
ncbi:D-3-phosphoglycerate dehydrogenase [Pectinophora gossypiella]|uniref:D-3-phosphoglycerate dehydrogenase n=1 Tax=Pectinophora gossypiella TaxID=13191 RepID=UPI00214EDA27|nr:D-3-phosphoglycerate dehydrogenase [Pectinophora gossypiella]XP_049886350.1 D-3-phosphoglycerate dehydrogenase [Pectinophora gossypiella]